MMIEHYPPILIDPTPDEILAVLVDLQRQQCTHDCECDPRVVLSGDSTIADWRAACDLLPWEGVAKGMNKFFSVNIALGEWHRLLEPATDKRLSGVCKLLAANAKLPRVRPAHLLGKDCMPAGAFLTVRSFLADAGADVSEIAPSTSLHEYTRRYARVFYGQISTLAPGTLPPSKVRVPVYDAFIHAMALAWVGCVVGAMMRSPWIAGLSLLAFVFTHVGHRAIGCRVLPASIKFGTLETFRDLAKAISAHAAQ